MTDPRDVQFSPASWQVVRLSSDRIEMVDIAFDVAEARQIAAQEPAATVVFRGARPVRRPPWEY